MKKKTINLVRVAMTLLFATFTSAGAWAGSAFLSQDEEGNYLIDDVDDWNTLADYVAAGNDCEGMTFLMTGNVGSADAPVTIPLGRQIGQNKENDRQRFAGTFDGGGHTLAIALNTEDEWWTVSKGYCSPFAYVKNATIKNLHVAGTVTTTGQWASGLVGSTGYNSNDGSCTIDKCQVSVEITANYVSTGGKYGNHGGFIGIAEGNATITNSWFDGKFLGVDYQYSAGFIGINKGAATLNNCLFNPSEISIENNRITGSCEFVHDMQNGTHTLTDAYWVKHFGEPENAQGQKVVTSLTDEIVNAQNYNYCVRELTAANGVKYYIVLHNPTWMDLQTLMQSSQTYEWNASTTAGTEDGALIVPNGVSFTLNLNGTLDRDLMLAEAKADGYVIKVEQGGTLTINGGTITGGNNTGDGAGIYNAGTLNINGVTIKDNYTQGDGGGIYNAGTLVINGATITGNLSKNVNSKGVGVYGGTISIEGNVQIHDNIYKNQTPTVVTAKNNLYLNTAMTINGSIEGSYIGVQTSSSDLVFTNGLKGNNGSLANFFSDKAGYELLWNNEEETEARLFEVILELANKADNSDNISHYINKVAKVVLKDRTFVKNDNWSTLCLPFGLTSFANTPLQGATVMKFKTETSGFSNGTLTLDFAKVTAIEAGKPYIVKWTNGQDVADPTFVDVKVVNADAMAITSNSPGDVSFVGSYDPVSIGSTGDNTKLYMGAGNNLYWPNGAMTIGSCRAYFQLNNGIKAGDAASVRSIVMNFDDETTGITTIAHETDSPKEGWFSLNGMKLYKQPTTKGLYILNGRKVVVK